jgi:MarR family transcriptional regulator, organic hydroperoxide resistance regulator
MTRKTGARQKPRAKHKAAPSALPPTTSRRALLKGGSDHGFRALVHDLLTVSSRMETVRGHLGARMGVSGPQYSVLIAIAHLQGEHGVSVGALAKALHVSNAFVASETGKLAQRGFLHKRTNPNDRRGILLSIAPAGRLEIGKIGDEICAINDLFFGALDAKAFAALSAAVGALVHSSRKAIHYVSAADRQELEAAE